jgi:hypothetical protein
VGEPVRVGVCHCLACQKRTGSAFGVQARFRAEQVTIRGESRIWERVGDEGTRFQFHFCGACGATVYWVGAVEPDLVGVAVGAFADRTFPAPRYAVYESRRHPWVGLVDVACAD